MKKTIFTSLAVCALFLILVYVSVSKIEKNELIYKAALNQLQLKNNSLSNENEKLMVKNSKLEAMLNSSKSEMDKQADSSVQIKEELNSLSKSYNDISSKYHFLNSSTKSQIDKLKSANRALIVSNKDTEKKFAKLTKIFQDDLTKHNADLARIKGEFGQIKPICTAPVVKFTEKLTRTPATHCERKSLPVDKFN